VSPSRDFAPASSPTGTIATIRGEVSAASIAES
jgi:hypothetical protein